MITSKDYTGSAKVLIRKSTNQPITKGDVLVDFRGDTATAVGGSAPHKAGSTGRVYVRLAGGFDGSFFPSVFDLIWADPKEIA